MKTIGLLGGSFNPAHDGHLHLSREAKRRLMLDQVWWLVSPMNPFKREHSDMAPYEDRVKSAVKTAKNDPFISVKTFERDWGTTYSIEIVRILQERYPADRFVWLMGDDLLPTFTMWKNSDELIASIPIAIFARGYYTLPRHSCSFTRKYDKYRVKSNEMPRLFWKRKPLWAFFRMKRNPLSSTQIRTEKSHALETEKRQKQSERQAEG